MAKGKKKKRVLKIKNIVIIFIILILFGGIVYYVLNMPVKNIYISGNKIVSDDEVLSLSGLDSYPSFLLTSSFDIKNSILNNKCIDDVNVIKRFGNVIELEIIEHSVIAMDMDGRLIMSSGFRLDNSYNISDIPRLISYVNDDIVSNFAKKFGKVDINILREVSEIEYSPVSVDSDRFLLYMNDGNLVYVTLTKVEKLNKYNDVKDELMDRKGIIYLDSGDYVELKG